MRAQVTALVLTFVATLSASASAHDVNGYLSSSGLKFVADQVPSVVPSQLTPPPLSKTLLTCPGGAQVTATQQNTQAHLDVKSVSITLPSQEDIRVDLTFSLNGSGQVHVTNPYACFGDTTCSDSVSIQNARVIADFSTSISSDGKPQVDVNNVDLQLSKNDIDVQFSNCALDSVANAVVGFAKDWLMGFIVGKVEDIATQQMSPMLDKMLAGFVDYQGAFGPFDVSAGLTDLHSTENGLFLTANVNLSNSAPADSCVGQDPGPPASLTGQAPDLTAGPPADVGVSVNLGLVNDALYQVWRQGLMCLTDKSLSSLGINLDVNKAIGAYMPNFPPGTQFSLKTSLAKPPQVTGKSGQGAELTLVADGVSVDIIGHTPSGADRTLHVGVDADATARVALDPTTSAVTLQVLDANVDKLDIDEVGAAQQGFDVAGIKSLLHDVLIPLVLKQIGTKPVTGSVFGMDGYYLILRDLETNNAFLSAKADLFRAPDTDTGNPDTAFAQKPQGVVNPSSAVFVVSGTDPEIPSQLLRYKVSVDGVSRSPSFLRQFTVGQAGVTKTYHVAVSAVDLAGNVDPSPVETDVTVDGVLPTVIIDGDPVQHIHGTQATLSWRLHDDHTAGDALVPRIELYRVLDPTNAMDTKLVGTATLPAGTTQGTFDVQPGQLYRVEIHALDEAGNDGSASVLIRVAGVGGCSVGGGAAGGGGAASLLLGVAVVLLALRRRRA